MGVVNSACQADYRRGHHVALSNMQGSNDILRATSHGKEHKASNAMQFKQPR